MLQSSPQQAERAANLNDRTVEIYLPACALRGTLETHHARVSDHLGTPEEVLRLSDVRVTLRDGRELARQRSVLVNKAEILFVIDLTPYPTGHLGFQVERSPQPVTVNVGNIWLRGKAHLPVGGEVAHYFTGAVNRFMALTEASVVGHDAARPRTVLINRDRVACLLAE